MTWPFALPHLVPSRHPRAVCNGNRVARRPRLAQERRTARSTDLQFVPVLTSLHRRRARVLSRRPSSPFGIWHGLTSRSSTGLTGCSGSDHSPSERSSSLPSPPSEPPHEVPGFGAVCSLVRLTALGPSRRRRHGSPLVSPSRPPVARVPSPSEPARVEPVDRRDFFNCPADPEGWESPIPPHGVPPSCLQHGEAHSIEGRENVESLGDGVGPILRAE